MNRTQRLRRFFMDLSENWGKTQPGRQAAALAYYSMFSLAPILFVSLTVAGLLINEEDLMAEFFGRLGLIIGQETVLFLADLVSGISVTTGALNLTTLISIGALFYAATGLFYHLQYSLNLIWEVPIEERTGILSFVKSRLLAFAMVIALGFVFALLVVAGFLLSFISSLFDVHFSYGLANIFIFLGIEYLTLVLVYKFIPQTRVAWRDVWLGAFLTAMVLNVAAVAVSIYISISNVSSAFEAAGALAVLLIAIYYASQIFLFGAMFTRVYASHFGSRRENGNLAEAPAG